MGSSSSNAQFVRDQMEKAKNKDYLVLDELLEVQPQLEHPIDLRHLGTLYLMDRHKCGRFYTEDLIGFADAYVLFRQAERFQQRLKFQSYCTLRLWNDVTLGGGQDAFVNWLTKLAVENNCLYNLEGNDALGPGAIHCDAVRSIHQLLQVCQTVGLDYSSFVELMQKIGPEREFDNAGEQEQEGGRAVGNSNDLSILALQLLAREFIAGFCDFMTELGFRPNIPLDK